MKKLTNLIVVDASGSMASKSDEVRGGLKQLFSQIREDAKKDKKKVSTHTIVIDFSYASDIRVLVDSKDSALLEDNLADAYSTRGMTALFDAIGKGFSMVPEKQDSVFVSIITDGLENDSKEYDKAGITELIEKKKQENWVVTFMGTTEEAIKQAQDWGLSRGQTMTFADSGQGVEHSFVSMSNARDIHYNNVLTKSYMAGEASEAMASLMDEAEELTKAQLKQKKDDKKL